MAWHPYALQRQVAQTVVGFVFMSSAALPSLAGYIVTDLGTLGGTFSQANAVNSSGQVAGASTFSALSFQHAFLASNGSLQDLGTLGITNTFSAGLGINDAGVVVGTARSTSSGLTTHAFLYDSTGMHDLGTLGGRTSAARDVNSSGEVVGFASTGPATHAFLYDGSMHDLGTLGGSSSFAYGNNDSGQIAGDSAIAGDAASHAFLYSAGVMQDLGTLGGTGSNAYAINASGQVAGGSHLSGDTAYHAFRYSNGTMLDLGTLGGDQSTAYGINASGQVVGTSNLVGDLFEPTAFLYSNGAMLNLNNLIAPGSGWHLDQANAINDAGQIVGYGTINGQTHAFLLTQEVPEPGTLTLFGLGTLGLAAARIRRRRPTA